MNVSAEEDRTMALEESPHLRRLRDALKGVELSGHERATIEGALEQAIAQEQAHTRLEALGKLDGLTGERVRRIFFEGRVTVVESILLRTG